MLELVQLTCTLCCEVTIKLIKDRELLLLFPQFIKYKTFELLWNLDITFQLVSESEVTNIIKSMKTKSCELDMLNTKIIKEHFADFIKIITKIVNTSLQHSVFTEKWKMAILRPLIKNLGLDLIYMNDKPVSSLSFLSKIVEKPVMDQLLNHCMTNNLYPEHQLAYVKNRSCETSLIILVNQILRAIEDGNITCAITLDLSAAFNTVDHDILLNLLGCGDTVMNWFDTYLYPQGFKVAINDVLSCSKNLNFSVPQGSAGGPILYNLYAAPLRDIISPNMMLRGFADDDTLSTDFEPNLEMELKTLRSVISIQVSNGMALDCGIHYQKLGNITCKCCK